MGGILAEELHVDPTEDFPSLELWEGERTKLNPFPSERLFQPRPPQISLVVLPLFRVRKYVGKRMLLDREAGMDAQDFPGLLAGPLLLAGIHVGQEQFKSAREECRDVL